MRCHDQQLLEAVAQAAAPKLSEFDEQALSTTMWASAKLMFRKQLLIDAMVLEVTNRDADLHQQGLANISWSCATLRIGADDMCSSFLETFGDQPSACTGNAGVQRYWIKALLGVKVLYSYTTQCYHWVAAK